MTTKPKWTGIVKVQRQLNEPQDATALITSNDDAIHVILPMTSGLLARFGDRLKFYCRAKLHKTLLNLGPDVQDRWW